MFLEKVMTPEQEKQLDLMREAIADYRTGLLSEFSVIVIFDLLLNPVEITQKDIDWAKTLITDIAT